MTLQELLGDSYKEGITIEEIQTFLQDKTLVDPTQGYVKKDVFDKTASEVARVKKELKEKMTEDEKKADEVKQQLEMFEELKRENALNKYEKTYLSNGYSAERAVAIAKALAENDFETAAKETAAHTKEVVENAKAEAMKGVKTPVGGGSTGQTGSSFGADLAKEQLEMKGLYSQKKND